MFAAFPKSFADKLIARGAQQAARRPATTRRVPSGSFVSHILLKTQAEADAALRSIQAGQKFADVAKLRSTDTGSAPQGGGLGCLTPNEFVAEFQNAAAAAPLGVVTGPVKSQFGYHLILVRKWDPVADESYVQALAQAAQRGHQRTRCSNSTCGSVPGSARGASRPIRTATSCTA